MSNKIVQSSNAVVDYTTIQALIDAVNSQQQFIDNLQSASTAKSTMVDSAGNIISQVQGVQKIQSHAYKIEKGQTSLKFTFPEGPFQIIPYFVASVSGTKAYAYVASGSDITKADVKVTLSTPADNGTYIHWVAVGI